MLENVSPGQTIECTVKTTPRRIADRKTIARLMRQDPRIKRGLRAAQEHRRRHTPTKQRGGRQWAQRLKAARIARVYPGATWKFSYTPLLKDDLEAVAKFIEVKGG